MVVAIVLVVGMVLAFLAIKIYQSNRRQGISYFRANSFAIDKDGKPLPIGYLLRASLPFQLGVIVLFCIVVVVTSIGSI